MKNRQVAMISDVQMRVYGSCNRRMGFPKSHSCVSRGVGTILPYLAMMHKSCTLGAHNNYLLS